MSFLSGIASSLFSKVVDYGSSSKLQHDAQDFAQEMSDTKHQREVADLKKAGLNPLLSAMSGASTPTSGIATTGATQNPALISATTAKMAAEKRKTDLEAKHTEAATKLVSAQEKSASAQALMDTITAERKAREFKAIDNYGTYTRKVVPMFESLPGYLRGPLRTLSNSGERYYMEFEKMLDGILNQYYKIKARQTRSEVMFDRQQKGVPNGLQFDKSGKVQQKYQKPKTTFQRFMQKGE